MHLSNTYSQAIAVALIVMSKSVCTSNDEDCRSGTQAEWVEGLASATVFVGMYQIEYRPSTSISLKCIIGIDLYFTFSLQAPSQVNCRWDISAI